MAKLGVMLWDFLAQNPHLLVLRPTLSVAPPGSGTGAAVGSHGSVLRRLQQRGGEGKALGLGAAATAGAAGDGDGAAGGVNENHVDFYSHIA